MHRTRRLTVSCQVALLVLLGCVVASPIDAAAAASRTSKPRITSVSPRTLPLSGGWVLVRGRKFDRPSAAVVRGDVETPARVKRKSATTLLVRVPRLSAGRHHIRLYNRNIFQRASALRKADVVTIVAPPTITRVVTAGGPARGGTRVTVLGRDFLGVSRVQFGALRGSSVTVASAGRLVVTAPRQQPGPVYVRITGRFGTSTAHRGAVYRYQAAPSAVRWTAVSEPDTLGSALVAVSCASSTFCVSADEKGRAYRWDGVAWSATTATGVTGTADVSCPTPTFCLLLSNGRDAVRFDGTTWSSASSISGGGLNVSCVSSTFCLAEDTQGYTEQWDGSGMWARLPKPIPQLRSLTCTTPTFCLAGGESGSASRWNGTSWTAIRPSGAPNALVVACAGPTLCVGSGVSVADDDVRVWRGSTWTPFSLEPTSPGVLGLACGSTVCVELGTNRARTFDGFAWSLPAPVATGTAAPLLACSRTTYCMTIADDGRISVGS